MLLTLLQSRGGPVPPPPPPAGGGGGGGLLRAERTRAAVDARARQRELLPRALSGEDTLQDLRDVAERIVQHDDTQARRIVRQIVDYRGEEHQLRALQQSVEVLEARLASRRAETRASLELQRLAAELRQALQEEEELLQVYEEIEHDDRILLLTAVSGRLPM